jgi:hypothetical protein
MLIAVVFLLICTPVLHAENRLLNGDFEQAGFAWRLDRGVRVTDDKREDSNSLCEVPLHHSETRGLSQSVRVERGDSFWKITLRVRPSRDFVSHDRDAEQVVLRLTRNDGTVRFTGHKVEARDRWQELRWDFTDFEGSENLLFEVECMPGEGELFIDEIQIEPL